MQRIPLHLVSLQRAAQRLVPFLVVGVVLLTGAEPALGQWPEPVWDHTDEQDDRLDPLLPTGIALSVAGVGMTTAGAMLLRGAEHTTEVCDVTGPCVTTAAVSDREGVAIGSGILAGGITMGVVGLSSAVFGGISGPGRRDVAADNLLMTGTWMTGVGGGMLATGIGLLVPLKGQGDLFEGAVGLTVAGGLTTVIGVPLLLYGAGERESGHVDGDHRYRGPGKLFTGMSLATLGAVGVGASLPLCGVAGHQSGSFAGLGIMLMCLPPLVVGVAGLGVGIPLWATGARGGIEPPDVSIGPGAVSMKWRY